MPVADPVPPDRVETPRRVRVTRTTSPSPTARRQSSRLATVEIVEQARIDDIQVTSLIKAQFRLALQMVASLVVGLGGLPLMFALVPATRTYRILQVPLPWLLLGFVVYPLTYLAGRLYVNRAERVEDAFSEYIARR
ncbi:MAG: hypothetical protein JWN95_138 [Frankiales bacterium]|nr:hypothetical protein [Frankiales bacterium]